MKKYLKDIIKKTPLNYFKRFLAWKRQIDQLSEWENNGRLTPPPHIVKQRVLKQYARKYNLKIFIETGTYYGDMVDAMKHIFDHIYSIELSNELFKRAKKRFKRIKNLDLIHGDSGEELLGIIDKLTQPALFWLDGHFSAGETVKGKKETPIYEELLQILDAPDRGHIIIVDDARCFGKEPDYPTLEQLDDLIKSKRSNLDIFIEDDIIRITPKP